MKFSLGKYKSYQTCSSSVLRARLAVKLLIHGLDDRSHLLIGLAHLLCLLVDLNQRRILDLRHLSSELGLSCICLSGQALDYELHLILECHGSL